MICSFHDRDVEELYLHGRVPRRLWALGKAARTARRKLRMIDAALDLGDLKAPPGNRLEPLHGDREGQHSIRINDRWQICSSFRDGAFHDVEIVDYHR